MISWLMMVSMNIDAAKMNELTIVALLVALLLLWMVIRIEFTVDSIC